MSQRINLNVKKSLETLCNAYEILRKNADKLPEEYKFLLEPKFQKKLQQVENNADKILMAAKMVAKQIGEDQVDENKVDEMVQYLKELGLVDENGKEQSQEKETFEDDRDVLDEPNEEDEKAVEENKEEIYLNGSDTEEDDSDSDEENEDSNSREESPNNILQEKDQELMEERSPSPVRDAIEDSMNEASNRIDTSASTSVQEISENGETDNKLVQRALAAIEALLRN